VELSQLLTDPRGGYEVCDVTFSGEGFFGEAAHFVFRGVTFERCRLSEAVLRGCSFTGCTFRSCDVSGARMDDSFISHATLSSLKGLGTTLTRAVMRDVKIEDCTFRYASFDGAKWDHAQIRDTSVQEASLSGMRLRETSLSACDLRRAVIFRTSMDKMDLRSCQLDGIVLSEDLRELRGATVEEFQAAALLRALGIRVL